MKLFKCKSNCRVNWLWRPCVHIICQFIIKQLHFSYIEVTIIRRNQWYISGQFATVTSIPGVPKKAKRFFENNKKLINWQVWFYHFWIIDTSILVYCDPKLAVKYESYDYMKFKFAKVKTRCPAFSSKQLNFSNSQKGNYSVTSLILSFSDWKCFILEFDIMKSTMSC